jgi:hypothetical protein
MIELLKARKEKPKYKPMMTGSSNHIYCFHFSCHSSVILVETCEVDEKFGTPKLIMRAQFMKWICCHTLLFIHMVFKFEIIAMSRSNNLQYY